MKRSVAAYLEGDATLSFDEALKAADKVKPEGIWQPAPEDGKRAQLKEFHQGRGNLSLDEALQIADDLPVEGKFERPPRPPATFNGRPVPEEGFAPDGERVYRGHRDYDNPAVRQRAAETGLPPKGPGADALDHVRANNAETNYCSTSKLHEVAKDFGERLRGRGNNQRVVGRGVAIIEAVNGVNVNVTEQLLQTAAEGLFAGQQEVSVWGGVRPQNVVGFLVWGEGVDPVFHANPTYVPCAGPVVPVNIPVNPGCLPPGLVPATAAAVALQVATRCVEEDVKDPPLFRSPAGRSG